MRNDPHEPSHARAAGAASAASAASAENAARRLGFTVVCVAAAGVPLLGDSSSPGLEAAATSSAFVAAAAAALALVLASPGRARRAAAESARRPIAAGLLLCLFCLFCALVILGLVQLVPVPDAVLTSIAPGSARVWQEAGAILSAAGRPAPAARISIAPSSTWATLLEVGAAAGLLFAAGSLPSSRRRRRILAAAAFAGACAGAAMAAPDAGGPAGRAALDVALLSTAAVALGWLLTAIRVRENRPGADTAERFESRILPLAVGALFLGATLAAVAIFGSRAAAISAGAGGIIAAGTRLLRRAGPGVPRGRALGLSAGAALLLLSALVGLRGWTFPLFEGGGSPGALALERREARWVASYRAGLDSPWLGSGLGGFEDAFRRVQPRELPGRLDAAPSEAAELFVTGGAAGLALGLSEAAALALSLAAAWSAQRHREESAIALAGLAFLGSLAVLSLFEPLSPSIAASLPPAVLLGLAWAAASRGGLAPIGRSAILGR